MYLIPARVELIAILAMAIPFGLLLVLIMDNNGQILADAELLTGEDDKKVHIEKVDDYGHPLWSKWTVIKNHNLLDQCMPQPALPYIMSFAIALQIGPNIFNAGIGTTICYSGQLNKYNNKNGMVPSAPFRILNVEKNPVTEICENIRKECEEKQNMTGCPNDVFLKSPWHGIQFKQKDNDMNVLEIRMSTTNKSFDVPVSNLADDMLILKLTRWNSVVTLLSTKFGPGYHMGKDALKEYGVIKQQQNYELFKTFWTNAGNGSSLHNHMGPWALSVDILPLNNDEPINFFVIRSNCSEVQASFLFPNELTSVELQNMDKMPITVSAEETSLKENHGIMVWGKIRDKPNHFTIQMINQIWDFTHSQHPFGMGILVNFTGTSSNIEFQAITNIRNNTWITRDQTEERVNTVLQFRAGELFTLQMISLNMSFNLSLNCGPYIELQRTWPITEGNKFFVNISGDVDIYKLELSGPADHIPNIHIETRHNVTLKPGRGYFLRAQLLNIWKMSITFYEFSQEDAKVPLVAFEAAYLDEHPHVNEYENDLNDTHKVRQVAITKATAQDFDETNGLFELHFVLASMPKIDEQTCTLECGKKGDERCTKLCQTAKLSCFDRCRKEGKAECKNCDDIFKIGENSPCLTKRCEMERQCMRGCEDVSRGCECIQRTRVICENLCEHIPECVKECFFDTAVGCDCPKREREKCAKECKDKAQGSIQNVLQFYLNERPIYEYWLSKGAEIGQITTVADANATSKLEHFTWNPPIIRAVQGNNIAGSRNLRYILRGKVPMNAEAFTIDFLSYTNRLKNLTLQNSECFLDLDYDCVSSLHIETNFKANHTIFASYLIEPEVLDKKGWQGNLALPSLFRQGEDFTIDCIWTLHNTKRFFSITIITSAGKTTKYDYVVPEECNEDEDPERAQDLSLSSLEESPHVDGCSTAPNYVQLIGDLILFGEPEVGAVAAEGKEQPANAPQHKMLH